jgi:hypothetical protein
MGAPVKVNWDRLLLVVAVPVFAVNVIMQLALNHPWWAYFWTLMISMTLGAGLSERDRRHRHKRPS